MNAWCARAEGERKLKMKFELLERQLRKKRKSPNSLAQNHHTHTHTAATSWGSARILIEDCFQFHGTRNTIPSSPVSVETRVLPAARLSKTHFHIWILYNGVSLAVIQYSWRIANYLLRYALKYWFDNLNFLFTVWIANSSTSSSSDKISSGCVECAQGSDSVVKAVTAVSGLLLQRGFTKIRRVHNGFDSPNTTTVFCIEPNKTWNMLQ